MGVIAHSMSDSVEQPGESFSARVRSAVFWRSGSQIVAQMVMWTATIFVVRLLDPHDYGLFAMSQVILVLFNFLNGYSFASGVIQAESVDSRRISQVFGLLILLNGGLAILQFLLAPLAGAYFRQPIVTDMLRVQALLYIATPFIALPSAILARSLDFRNQAKANLAGALAGAGAALTGALCSMGVWTLVIAPIIMMAVRAIGLTLASGIRLRPTFRFDGLGSILSFGGALLLCQLFWIIQSQSDVFLAGRQLDPHNLGLYTEALFLTQIVTAKFIPPLNEVAFPAYATLHKEGGKVGPAFLTSVRLTMLIAMPLYLGMAVVAWPLVETLFGDKWLEMAPLVATLALAMPFFALQIICSPSTNALGMPGVYVRTSIAGAIIMPVAFMAGMQWGIEGMTRAWLVATPLLLLVTLALTLPKLGLGWRDILLSVLPTASAALAMAAVVHAIAQEIVWIASPLRLAILVAVGAAVYGGLLFAFSRETLVELKSFITKRQLPAEI